MLRKGPVVFAGMCSGAGTDIVVADALEQEWNSTYAEEFGVKWVSEHLYAVEMDDAKRDLLIKNFPQLKFVFKDCMEMGRGRAFCYKANKYVDVHSFKVDVLFAGFPCKDLSGLNNDPKAFVDRSGKTGGPNHFIAEYIRQARPRSFILENVTGILNITSKNNTRRHAIEAT